jgi:hypothetical protein
VFSGGRRVSRGPVRRGGITQTFLSAASPRRQYCRRRWHSARPAGRLPPAAVGEWSPLGTQKPLWPCRGLANRARPRASARPARNRLPGPGLRNPASPNPGLTEPGVPGPAAPGFAGEYWNRGVAKTNRSRITIERRPHAAPTLSSAGAFRRRFCLRPQLADSSVGGAAPALRAAASAVRTARVARGTVTRDPRARPFHAWRGERPSQENRRRCLAAASALRASVAGDSGAKDVQTNLSACAQRPTFLSAPVLAGMAGKTRGQLFLAAPSTRS